MSAEPRGVVDGGNPTGAVNPKYRYFVKRGTRGMDEWVVIDRKVESIAAGFDSRDEARLYVADMNRSARRG